MKQQLIRCIENYTPYCEQEQKEKEVILNYLNEYDNLLTRENEYAHFTASSLIVNKGRTKTLLIYHNIYDSWAWTGGHADGCYDMLEVAIKEAQEETGVLSIVPVDEQVFSLDMLPVFGHIKKGKYVAPHMHLNLTYLLEADESADLIIKPDENSGVKWFMLDEMCAVSSEPEMIKVYKKLIEKLKNKA